MHWARVTRKRSQPILLRCVILSPGLRSYREEHHSTWGGLPETAVRGYMDSLKLAGRAPRTREPRAFWVASVLPMGDG
jgi:hypothetical protein